jgi:3-hydroxyisobutyrate dehydrogenase-like beta-hydroxyacid dehydrogenase
MRIALLHPGAMGSTVGRAAVGAGHSVSWVGEGRSAASRARAEGFTELRCLDDVASLDAVLSVCPPEAATELADAVLATGFRGLYVDANAIAPATTRTIAERVARAGGRFVDGGLIGPPARRAGTTRLYLSGPEAALVAEWFAGSVLEAIVVGDEAGAASALKMAYAAWSKATSALLLGVAALAEHEGVADALRGEWDRSQPGLTARLLATAPGVAPKAWRFVAEMEEIAATFAAAGLTPRFHEGAAEVYRCLEAFKDREGVTLPETIAALRRG